MSFLDEYDPDAVPLHGQSQAVPSPCMSICQMDQRQQYCTGCWRSIDEITRWANASDADKREIWRQIKLRKSALTS